MAVQRSTSSASLGCSTHHLCVVLSLSAGLLVLFVPVALPRCYSRLYLYVQYAIYSIRSPERTPQACPSHVRSASCRVARLPCGLPRLHGLLLCTASKCASYCSTLGQER